MWRATPKDSCRIHDEWLHRLGNLTLTGYNSKYSNAPFTVKRDCEHGLRDSGLRMNQKIAQQDEWGEKQMEERTRDMVRLAVESIWPMPATAYRPQTPDVETHTLSDEDFDPEGLGIERYAWQGGADTPVKNWFAMYEHVIQYLHAQDPSVLMGIIHHPATQPGLAPYLADSGEKGRPLRSPYQIADGVWVETNNNSALKLTILRRLLPLYGADPNDLTFTLRNTKDD